MGSDRRRGGTTRRRGRCGCRATTGAHWRDGSSIMGELKLLRGRRRLLDVQMGEVLLLLVMGLWLRSKKVG